MVGHSENRALSFWSPLCVPFLEIQPSVLVRRSAATSALGRSAAVRERRSLRGAAQRSSGDDHVDLSFQNQRSPREPASTSSLLQLEVKSSPRLERQAKSFFFAWRNLFPSLVLVFQSLSDYTRPDQGQGHVFMPCFTGRRASSRSYVVFGFLPSGPTRSLHATDHRLG